MTRTKKAAWPTRLRAKTQTTYPKSSETFANSKKDKRTIKHSTFVNKIEKSITKPKKRRRPNKKLVATLESLADALPDLDGEVTNRNGAGELLKQANIKHKTLKTRPGSMKKKQKVEKAERERFGKNLAQLASVQKEAGISAATSGLAALKIHIAEQIRNIG